MGIQKLALLRKVRISESKIDILSFLKISF